THAICDAVLGAIGERDIGSHFPDTDPRYKGASSLTLLREVLTLSYSKGFIVENIDTVIVSEKPKLQPYVSEIKKGLASVIELPEQSLGIKATTSDGMGFTGRGEGIAAYAVALMKIID
ncbi:MAG: 2-C-methyl-D-erythritol 2,4-cyclodiphosphate synthase, partial [Candidatus Dadabacteria bacterium]|nr:2-C-methyl-D-erythritol 2,4-cyclodiphosphate synthase [Candidatus Dadabacteria bacterium]